MKYSQRYQDEVETLTEHLKAGLLELGPLPALSAEERAIGVDALTDPYAVLVTEAVKTWLTERRYELSYSQICIAFFTALEALKK